jgi:hypothetical protein
MKIFGCAVDAVSSQGAAVLRPYNRKREPTPKWALGGDSFRGGRSCEAGAGEEIVGFHPESENGAEKEQTDAAEKRQFPVTRFVDDESKDKRGKDRRERRAGVHESAGRAGKPRSDVHGDGPHRANSELGKEKAKAQENRGLGQVVHK